MTVPVPTTPRLEVYVVDPGSVRFRVHDAVWAYGSLRPLPLGDARATHRIFLSADRVIRRVVELPRGAFGALSLAVLLTQLASADALVTLFDPDERWRPGL
jgi:hypothetical protein